MGYGNVVILRSGLLKAIVESSPAKTGARGRPQEYSEVAIETVLFIRQVFYLLLCQTEGFMNSLARVMKADITIADQLYSWDITYLASIILGQFFYLNLFLDIFRRKSWAARCMKRKTAPGRRRGEVLRDLCYRESTLF